MKVIQTHRDPYATAAVPYAIYSPKTRKWLCFSSSSLLFPFLSRPISTLDLAYISHVSIFVRGQVFKGNNDLSTHNSQHEL